MHVEYPKPRWSDKFLLLDMLEGLKTTFRELFKPKVTIRYPEERLEPANRFRGMFKFSFDRCIACKLCALACPIDIIYIDVHDEQREVDGKMRTARFMKYVIDTPLGRISFYNVHPNSPREGLASVRGRGVIREIVSGHGGAISVERAPEGGLLIRYRLPAGGTPP